MMFFRPNLDWTFVAMTLSVAGARVAVGIHYVSDVIIGLALGALVAWAGLALQSHLSPL
jgi:undecaprenyl-diphosphatase